MRDFVSANPLTVRLFPVLMVLFGTMDISATTNYRVSVPDPSHNVFHVEAIFSVLAGKLSLRIPASRTGDAGPKGYQAFVENVNASWGAKKLSITRRDPWSWELVVPKPGKLRVDYDVAGDTKDILQLDSHWVSDEGGYIDLTSLILYTDGSRTEDAELRLLLPSAWTVATALPSASGTYTAKNLDTLLDGPILFGNLTERSLVVHGIPHHLVFSSGIPPYDTAALEANIRKICDYEIQLFRSAPHPTYTALFRWRPDLPYGGGIEHLGSMFMNVGKEWMINLPVNLSGTFAHEYFHSWNGAAMHPRDLAISPLDRQLYSRLLWFQEGVTSYYAYLTLTRTAITSIPEFFDSVSRDIAGFESGSGRTHMSLSDASVIAGFSSVQSLDYYAGGEVVGFLLDLYIRENSHGQHSLDDVLRSLYKESKRAGYKGYTEDDLHQAVSVCSGKDAKNFVHSLVESRERIDYATLLAGAGLSLVRTTDKGEEKSSVTILKDATPEQRELIMALLQTSR